MANLLKNLLRSPFSVTHFKTRCFSVLQSCTINRDTYTCNSVSSSQILNQHHYHLLSRNAWNSLNRFPRRYLLKGIQVAPNKYSKMKKEAPAGSLISMDGNVNSLEVNILIRFSVSSFLAPKTEVGSIIFQLLDFISNI